MKRNRKHSFIIKDTKVLINSGLKRKECSLKDLVNTVIKDEAQDIYIYIISNSSFPDWFKVGRTINIRKRLTDYQTGDPHRRFKVEYVRKVNNIDSIENDIYFQIKKIYSSVEVKSEWITGISVEMLIGIIEISAK